MNDRRRARSGPYSLFHCPPPLIRWRRLVVKLHRLPPLWWWNSLKNPFCGRALLTVTRWPSYILRGSTFVGAGLSPCFLPMRLTARAVAKTVLLNPSYPNRRGTLGDLLSTNPPPARLAMITILLLTSYQVGMFSVSSSPSGRSRFARLRLWWCQSSFSYRIGFTNGHVICVLYPG